RRKLAFQVRKERAPPRDYRRTEPLAGADPAAAPGPSPSRQAEAADLLRAFRRRLSAEERALAEVRARGLGWAEVAEQVGGTPEGRRKQLARAVQRVSRALGLDEAGRASGARGPAGGGGSPRRAPRTLLGGDSGVPARPARPRDGAVE